MSGSGGGRSDYDTSVPIGAPPPRGGGGGGGGGGGEDPCDITQNAPINSPVPSVVTSLSIGDILDLALGGSSTHPVLEVRTVAGQLAGSLTQVGHLALIRCIRAGHRYSATVVQRIGGAVVVRIERT